MKKIRCIQIYLFLMEDEQQPDFGENIDTVLKKSKVQEEQMIVLYNQKEKMLQVHYEQLRQLISQIWQIKEHEYQEHIISDPFVAKYLKDLEEEINPVDWNLAYQQSEENNETKQERELQLSKLRELWNAQQQMIGIVKGYTDLSSAHKSLMEELNTSIFKIQQEREIMENNQSQFSMKLKHLRTEIKSITEKNQKLMKEIENNKSSY